MSKPPSSDSIHSAADGATWPPELDLERAQIGARIGNYQLQEQIGVGGMGVVYRAEQLHPVKRTVAIKLMKLGTHSPAALARFQSERQTLALLEHPGIARVYDAGATDLGRPYVVMEFVAGVPINEYCDQRKLSTKQRLELFEQVCHAVQHAHFKGILHRDLKPSNILVTEIDGRAQCKAIDFGIAKMLQADEELPFATRVGQFVGTPAYTSPEQAAGEDVDTRADVYSLGVVLYELLSGALPLDADTYKSPDSSIMAKRILEANPPRPSERVSTSAVSSSLVAAPRADSGALRKELRGDLDRIVMKAIDRDRTQRYGTALALADDIQRHLNHEPILARPPTLSYQVRKFAQRNRILVAASLLALCALVIGATAATIGLVRARQALAREAAALTDERNARQTAQNVSDFLSEMLSSVDPKQAQGKPVMVRDVLDKAAGELSSKFVDQPLVAAALHATVSETYHGLGLFEQSLLHARLSVELFRKHLGEDSTEVLEAMEQLGKVLRANREYAEAEAVLTDLVERRRRISGSDAMDTCDAEEALGLVLLNTGRAKEAYPLVSHSAQTYQRVNGLDDRKTLAAMHNLGSVENALGNTAAAETIYRQVSEARQRVLGPDHPWTLLTMNNLATSLLQQRRFAEAEPILRELLIRANRVNGTDHEATIDVLNALGSAVQLQGKKSEAEQLFREMLLRSRRAFPSTHENVVKSLATLALALDKDGKFDEALEYYREAYALLPKSDVAPRQAAQYSRSYALLLFNTGKRQESEVPLRDAIKRMKTANIAKSVGYRETILALAKVCEESGKVDEAKALREEAAAMTPASQPATRQAS